MLIVRARAKSIYLISAKIPTSLRFVGSKVLERRVLQYSNSITVHNQVVYDYYTYSIHLFRYLQSLILALFYPKSFSITSSMVYAS